MQFRHFIQHIRQLFSALFLLLVLAGLSAGQPAAAQPVQLRRVYMPLLVRMPTALDYLNNYRALANPAGGRRQFQLGGKQSPSQPVYGQEQSADS